MSVSIKEVKNKSGYRQFVKLQFDIYKNSKFWVPSLKSDELRILDPDTNPAFDFCKAGFWLAYKKEKCVGRIGVIINEQYNEKTGEKLARFTRLEFVDDAEVIQALMNTAEKWAKEHGMKGIIGPLGFSNLDQQGLLVEGFDYLPSIASTYHEPYYFPYLEKLGYQKEIDWLEFRLTVGKAAVEKANRGSQLIQKRYGIEVVHFKTTKELMGYADKIFEILNDAFGDLPFVSPFSEKLASFYAKKYTRFLNPEFVVVIKIKGESIGFIVGMPSLSEAMQHAKGELFPLGFYYLLKAKKGKDTDTVDQMLTGVKKEYQATGAGVVLMAELQNIMLSKGMKYIETTGIFETNSAAISNWKNYDNIQHKRRRCYRKMF